jgi:hypothetical protein
MLDTTCQAAPQPIHCRALYTPAMQDLIKDNLCHKASTELHGMPVML